MRVLVQRPDALRVPAADRLLRRASILPPALRRARSPTSWRRSTSAPTASTWWSRATRTASSSSSTACARWCGSPPASTRTAGIDKDVAARALACLAALRPAAARHARRQRARGRHQRAAHGAPQAGLPRARARGARPPDRDHLRHGGGAPDLFGRRAHHAERARAAAWWSTSAAAAPSSSSARADEPLELESLQMGCVSLSERFFRDGKLSAKRFERARLAARLELEPIQAAFRARGWEHARRQLRHRARHRRGDPRARPRRHRDHAGGTRERARAPASMPATCASSTSSRSPRSAGRCFPAASRSSPRSSASLEIKEMRFAEGAHARGPAVRHARPLTRRGRARAHRARDAAALSRRCRAGRARRGHGAATSSSRHARPGGSRIRWRELALQLGRAAARDRARRLAQRLSPPRRLPARERRHAGLPARGAAPAGAPGRRAPPQADARAARGAGSAVGPQRAST